MARRPIPTAREQLSLFTPSEIDPPKKVELVEIQITHEGLYLGPVSPWTGGGLNAVEAARVARGLSIARGGAILPGGREARCVACHRYCSGLGYGEPIQNWSRYTLLYRAVGRYGPVPGDTYRCGHCNQDFIAHSDERSKP